MKLEMKGKKSIPKKSTQSFLRISEIKSDIIVLDNGNLRAIVAVSSTNFDLKSQEEQDAIIFSFQRFLNSLEFPIQILMQSRRMDIGAYLGKIKSLVEKQTNELLRVQTTEYMDFIGRLVENASIMNKNFYIVIPLDENILPKAPGLISRVLGSGKTKVTEARIENFEKAKEKLDSRVLAIMANLSSVGVKGMRLKTGEIIQLFYNSYNYEAGPAIDPKALEEIKTAAK
jgi:hypothetical protein